MSHPRLIHDVDDDYIEGSLDTKAHPCGCCGHKTIVIFICSVRLNMPTPENLENILFFKAFSADMPHIGVGCGCYAKAHRQIAHIRTRLGQVAQGDK